MNRPFLTRRSFVKTSALGALALTPAGFLGACTPQMPTTGLTFSDAIARDCKDIGLLNLTRKTKQNVIVNSKGDRFVSEDVPDQSVIMNSLLFDGNGPFYVLEIGAKMIGTMDGVKTNEKMQVMSEDGQPIEGLLAAGEVTNRDLYNQMYLGGVSIGCYTTMGRLAGITASETLSA